MLLLSLLISLLFISCQNPVGSEVILVQGTVQQIDTNIPIQDVVITIGDESFTTKPDGKYIFYNITYSSITITATQSNHEQYQTTLTNSGHSIVHDIMMTQIS